MAQLPPKLAELVEEMSQITDRRERAEMLIEIADRFSGVRVPASMAEKPYDERHRVPACESDAFVWSEEQPGGTLKFYFDVLNPQGLSAMAMSVIIDETLTGQPLQEILAVPDEVVLQLFGSGLSMGKGAGLMGILGMVRAEARRRLQQDG